jgi:hypothetical protein
MNVQFKGHLCEPFFSSVNREIGREANIQNKWHSCRTRVSQVQTRT